MIFKRVGIFFRLKAYEMFGWLGDNDWGYLGKNIGKGLMIASIVYASLMGFFGATYFAEKNLGWTWQYEIVSMMGDSDKLKSDLSLVGLVDEIKWNEIGKLETVAIFGMLFPILAAVILFVYAVWGLGFFLVLLLLMFLGIGIGKLFIWLKDNWKKSGEIVRGESKYPWEG